MRRLPSRRPRRQPRPATNLTGQLRTPKAPSGRQMETNCDDHCNKRARRPDIELQKFNLVQYALLGEHKIQVYSASGRPMNFNSEGPSVPGWPL